MIARIRVEALFQGAGGQTQRLPSCRHLQGFEIQFGDRLRT
jgi:hypothetical protein